MSGIMFSACVCIFCVERKEWFSKLDSNREGKAKHFKYFKSTTGEFEMQTHSWKIRNISVLSDIASFQMLYTAVFLLLYCFLFLRFCVHRACLLFAVAFRALGQTYAMQNCSTGSNAVGVIGDGNTGPPPSNSTGNTRSPKNPVFYFVGM